MFSSGVFQWTDPVIPGVIPLNINRVWLKLLPGQNFEFAWKIVNKTLKRLL